MSTPKRIFTFSAGSQTVSLAEFRPGKKGELFLHAFESRELIADPAADATRVSQTALALGEMVESIKAAKHPLRMTLAAQSTFSRMVKIPAMSGADLEQTVMFEAKQNIPFPLEEVIWDHRVVYETQAHEPEVLISAAKTDLLEEYSAAVEDAKMQPTGIELAAIASYNAFRYNYGEPEGCSLLMDLGARTTNLIFIEPGRFFIRTISSGGSALSSAVSKEFSEPVALAETRKRETGFIGQGSNYEQPEDPDQARLVKVLRNAVTRLHAEVTRSISFYRSQQGGAAPQRAYLCGNGVRTPLMKEFWEEKLGIPVELFNPLRCIGISKGADAAILEREAVQLGEHVGLAIHALWECPVSVNLLPPALKRKSRIAQTALALGLSAACLSAPLLAWGFHLRLNAEMARTETTKIEPQISDTKKLSTEIKRLQDQIQTTLKLSKPMENAIRDRRYWVTLLDQIHACLPEELVWITSFEVVDPAPMAPGQEVQPKGPSAAGGPGGAQAPAQTRLVLKGYYLENPKGVGVVDAFGEALKAQSKRVQSFVDASEKLAAARKNASKDPISEAEKLVQEALAGLKQGKLSDQPVLFQVTPVEEWTRTNRPNPTEWAQDFTIPLVLTAPPSKPPVLAP